MSVADFARLAPGSSAPMAAGDYFMELIGQSSFAGRTDAGRPQLPRPLGVTDSDRRRSIGGFRSDPRRPATDAGRPRLPRPQEVC